MEPIQNIFKMCLCEIDQSEEMEDKNLSTNVPLSGFLSPSLCCPSNPGTSESEWLEMCPSAKSSDFVVTGTLFRNRSISVMRREEHS